ncbi:MAG: phosphate acyltransferase PlsX [Acidimicrobiales bacterium]|nr:phosphate acyltransferase PlsX [Acidimicrobiales bacterium]
MTTALPIAVDAMGGDFAPRAVVEGALLAAERDRVGSLLVGDQKAIYSIDPSLGAHPMISVRHASEVIAMGAEPASSVRRMKDSSIVRAAEAVRDGAAAGVLSAGNTGAAMAASLLRIGRVKGVLRPAIAVPFPVLGSTPCTLLDCGANPDATPEMLVQFGQLGAVYARSRFGIEQPRVAILTIGEEAGKGNTLVKDSVGLFETTDWEGRCGARFVGNLEGRDLMTGDADVMVADGFTGNVVLKSLEGGVAIALDAIRAAMVSTPEAASTAPILEPILDPLFRILDPNLIGAAMLCGTRGISVISHGSSDADTIANAIRTSHEMAESSIVDDFRAVFSTS